MRRTAPVSAPKTKSFRRDPEATGQNSCQPEGLQPESALAALLVLAIERLLPSPGALPSPILAATHTCFIMLWALSSSDAMRLRAGRVCGGLDEDAAMAVCCGSGEPPEEPCRTSCIERISAARCRSPSRAT